VGRDGARSPHPARAAPARRRLSVERRGCGGSCDAAPEPRQPGIERPVHDRIGHAHATPSLGERDGPPRRVERPGEVGQAVLAKLRDLDPCLDRDRSRTLGEIQPARHRVVVPPEPAEQPTALDRHALDRPR
jgi:hypothetical protein